MEKLIRGKSLSTKAYDYLLAMISDMKPGQNKLPSEDELARSMGISRATVREALKLLLHEGVITTVHGKGTFAHPAALRARNRMDLYSDYYVMLSKSYSDVRVNVRWQEYAFPSELFIRTFGAAENVYSLGLEYVADGKQMLYCYFDICTDYIVRPVEDISRIDKMNLPKFSNMFMKSTIDYCIFSPTTKSDRKVAANFNCPPDMLMHCWEEMIYDLDDNLVATGSVFAHPDNMVFTSIAHFEVE